MTLTRWVPRESYGLGDRWGRELGMMNRLFDNALRAFDRDAEWFDAAGTFPRVDLLDANDEYVMRADLPGLRREDVEIEVSPDHVVVKGRYAESEPVDSCVVCSERTAGSFERSIPFPGEVRVEDVSASMKDGLLTIHLPKAQSTSVRKIELTDH